MPFVPQNPEVKKVQTTATKTVDTFHIHNLHINLNPNNPLQHSITVKWSEGYVESGVYIPAEHHTDFMIGMPVVSGMITPVTEGRSRYDEIKIAVWTMMQEHGFIPEGDIF